MRPKDRFIRHCWPNKSFFSWTVAVPHNVEDLGMFCWAGVHIWDQMFDSQIMGELGWLALTGSLKLLPRWWCLALGRLAPRLCASFMGESRALSLAAEWQSVFSHPPAFTGNFAVHNEGERPIFFSYGGIMYFRKLLVQVKVTEL